MTEEEQRKIFAKNLNYYIAQSDLIDDKSFKEPSEEFFEIVAKLGADDEQFQKIIIDYYHMSPEKKMIFCEFFNTFVSEK